MVSNVRFNAGDVESAIVSRVPRQPENPTRLCYAPDSQASHTSVTPEAGKDSTRTCAECVVCTCSAADRKLPTTSAGHSPVPAQTPALHESTRATYRRWLRCGTKAADSPAPATSCRLPGQMCCSDMLHIFHYRLVAATRMLTVRSAADIRTNMARGRYLGPPRERSRRKVYVAAARMLKSRSSADKRTNTAHGRNLRPPRG